MKTDITHCLTPRRNHSYLYGRCEICEVLRRDADAAKKEKLNAASRKHKSNHGN